MSTFNEPLARRILTVAHMKLRHHYQLTLLRHFDVKSSKCLTNPESHAAQAFMTSTSFPCDLTKCVRQGTDACLPLAGLNAAQCSFAFLHILFINTGSLFNNCPTTSTGFLSLSPWTRGKLQSMHLNVFKPAAPFRGWAHHQGDPKSAHHQGDPKSALSAILEYVIKRRRPKPTKTASFDPTFVDQCQTRHCDRRLNCSTA